LKNKIVSLIDVASVSAGYAFRGKIKEFPDGTIDVIQMKDIDETHRVDWTSLMKTRISENKSPNWLKKSDILFLARGNNNHAVYLDVPSEQTLCSPHFLRIHVRNESEVLPKFLAWQINQKPAQEYLSRVGEGNKVGNIRRSVLESIPIVIPTITNQSSIIEFNKLVNNERDLLLQQINIHQLMMTSIAQQLFDENQSMSESKRMEDGYGN